jgi:quinolinate synthase
VRTTTCNAPATTGILPWNFEPDRDRWESDLAERIPTVKRELRDALLIPGLLCMCATMYRIDRPHLVWYLDSLAQGTPVNRIKVPAEAARWAGIAPQRMREVN